MTMWPTKGQRENAWERKPGRERGQRAKRNQAGLDEWGRRMQKENMLLRQERRMGEGRGIQASQT